MGDGFSSSPPRYTRQHVKREALWRNPLSASTILERCWFLSPPVSIPRVSTDLQLIDLWTNSVVQAFPHNHSSPKCWQVLWFGLPPTISPGFPPTQWKHSLSFPVGPDCGAHLLAEHSSSSWLASSHKGCPAKAPLQSEAGLQGQGSMHIQQDLFKSPSDVDIDGKAFSF